MYKQREAILAFQIKTRSDLWPSLILGWEGAGRENTIIILQSKVASHSNAAAELRVGRAVEYARTKHRNARGWKIMGNAHKKVPGFSHETGDEHFLKIKKLKNIFRWV